MYSIIRPTNPGISAEFPETWWYDGDKSTKLEQKG